MLRAWFLSGLLFAQCGLSIGQMPGAEEQISLREALDRVEARSILTSHGKPFHAFLELTEEHHDPAYAGSVEVFWAGDSLYRLQVKSAQFSQTLVVNGSAVQESDEGDFYPGWLQNFVTALLNPIPRLESLRDRNGSVRIGSDESYSCVQRDDRAGGITDQVTWASVCFSGPKPEFQFVSDFSYNMEFGDTKRFEGKFVARSYKSNAGDHAHIRGRLKRLEAWQPVEAMLAVEAATPPDKRILTTLVSTAREESLLEHAPEAVKWPPVPEGKREGYMIVRALTDRTGQVREASKHNSDNALLESFGRELALQYKFKPLIVDGVAQQMEMPLVLHFTAAAGKPLPTLTDEQTRARVTGCSLPREIADPASFGKEVTITFYVVEDGGLSQIGISDRAVSPPVLYGQFRSCHFGVLQEDGKAIPYYANLLVTAR